MSFISSIRDANDFLIARGDTGPTQVYNSDGVPIYIGIPGKEWLGQAALFHNAFDYFFAHTAFGDYPLHTKERGTAEARTREWILEGHSLSGLYDRRVGPGDNDPQLAFARHQMLAARKHAAEINSTQGHEHVKALQQVLHDFDSGGSTGTDLVNAIGDAKRALSKPGALATDEATYLQDFIGQAEAKLVQAAAPGRDSVAKLGAAISNFDKNPGSSKARDRLNKTLFDTEHASRSDWADADVKQAGVWQAQARKRLYPPSAKAVPPGLAPTARGVLGPPGKLAPNPNLGDWAKGLVRAGWEETAALFYPLEVLADYAKFAASNPGGALALITGGDVGAWQTVGDMAKGTLDFVKQGAEALAVPEEKIPQFLKKIGDLCTYLRQHGGEVPARAAGALQKKVDDIAALYAKGDPVSLWNAGREAGHLASGVFAVFEGGASSGKALLGKTSALVGKMSTTESAIVATLKNLKPEQVQRAVAMAAHLAERPEVTVRVPEHVISALRTGLEANAGEPGVKGALRQLDEMKSAGTTRLSEGQRTVTRPALSGDGTVSEAPLTPAATVAVQRKIVQVELLDRYTSEIDNSLVRANVSALGRQAIGAGQEMTATRLASIRQEAEATLALNTRGRIASNVFADPELQAALRQRILNRAGTDPSQNSAVARSTEWVKDQALDIALRELDSRLFNGSGVPQQAQEAMRTAVQNWAKQALPKNPAYAIEQLLSHPAWQQTLLREVAIDRIVGFDAASVKAMASDSPQAAHELYQLREGVAAALEHEFVNVRDLKNLLGNAGDRSVTRLLRDAVSDQLGGQSLLAGAIRRHAIQEGTDGRTLVGLVTSDKARLTYMENALVNQTLDATGNKLGSAERAALRRGIDAQQQTLGSNAARSQELRDLSNSPETLRRLLAEPGTKNPGHPQTLSGQPPNNPPGNAMHGGGRDRGDPLKLPGLQMGKSVWGPLPKDPNPLPFGLGVKPTSPTSPGAQTNPTSQQRSLAVQPFGNANSPLTNIVSRQKTIQEVTFPLAQLKRIGFYRVGTRANLSAGGYFGMTLETWGQKDPRRVIDVPPFARGKVKDPGMFYRVANWLLEKTDASWVLKADTPIPWDLPSGVNLGSYVKFYDLARSVDSGAILYDPSAPLRSRYRINVTTNEDGQAVLQLPLNITVGSRISVTPTSIPGMPYIGVKANGSQSRSIDTTVSGAINPQFLEALNSGLNSLLSLGAVHEKGMLGYLETREIIFAPKGSVPGAGAYRLPNEWMELQEHLVPPADRGNSRRWTIVTSIAGSVGGKILGFGGNMGAFASRVETLATDDIGPFLDPPAPNLEVVKPSAVIPFNFMPGSDGQLVEIMPSQSTLDRKVGEWVAPDVKGLLIVPNRPSVTLPGSVLNTLNGRPVLSSDLPRIINFLRRLETPSGGSGNERFVYAVVSRVRMGEALDIEGRTLIRDAIVQYSRVGRFR